MDFISNLLAFEIEELPYVFIALMVAFTLHEFAHAYSAYLFGDHTAKDQGRVSLNPRVHLDVVGTILIFIAGFGWAKPVPVRRDRFKHPRLMGVIVSVVGPLSNLLIAFVSLLAFYIFIQFGWLENMSVGVSGAFLTLFNMLIGLNLLLFVFNLIPLPPLDGYRIIEDIAPSQLRAKMSELERWSMVVFLVMVFIPPIRAVTLDPILALTEPIFRLMNGIMSALFGFSI